MSGSFDLDDLLDDVLDSTVPVNANSLLDDLADELLGSAPSKVDEVELKYPELAYIPEELQKEWESTITKDEEVMKLRKAKKLSNAYENVESNVKKLTLQKFFSLMLEDAIKNKDNSKEVIEKMVNDEKMVNLFKDELKKKVRFCINKNDGDIIKGDFPHIKNLMDM